MSASVRHIGLSLGADLCWPLCFEAIIRELGGRVRFGGEDIDIEVERVTIEPYALKANHRYDVVLDRLTHWFGTSREWIKKAILMDGTYVLNNPWSLQSMEKQTTYAAMTRLGMPVPETWMVPPKEHEPSEDLAPTLSRYAKMFDLGVVGKQLGYPMYMKPYSGGGWKGVTRIEDEGQLRAAYEASGTTLMHLQKAVDPFTKFIRCVGIGPQLNPVTYAPSAPLHDRYTVGQADLTPEERSSVEDVTITINAFFGWDFNSCESLLSGETWHPIDFANACPDSQVTSLHYHFPWLVLSKVRWALFCAATRRRMPPNLDWQPYFDIADRDPEEPLRSKLAAYGDLSRQRLDATAFDDFCGEALGDLEAIAARYFESDEALQTVRQKVMSLFPEHEVDEFTDLFWQRIQSAISDRAAAATS